MPAQNCPTELTGIIGDTIIKSYNVQRVTDSTTNPETKVDLDLTAATISFTAKNDRQDVDGDAVFQKTVGAGITITDATGGDFDVKITSTDSNVDGCGKDFVELFYDVEVTLGATNGPYVSGDVITVDSGTLTLRAATTTS